MSEGGEGGGRLVAMVDGVGLSEAEARALWAEFSQYMEEHKGDTAGFAQQKGWAGVAPTFQAGRAVLVVWTQGPPPAAATAGAGKAGPPRGGSGNGGRRRRGPGKPGGPRKGPGPSKKGKPKG